MSSVENLSKTEQKLFDLISPQLESLQLFVDECVKAAGTMPAKVICQKFYEEFDDLDRIPEDDFIKAFRLSIRIGKITNLIGAKRAGYRHVNAVKSSSSDQSSASSASDRTLEAILPYIEDLQAFVDRRIQGEVRMTASKIYERFIVSHKCDLSQDDFVKSFRVALREGKISGLESAYRFGYKRRGSSPTSNNSSTSKSTASGSNHVQVPEHCEIIIDDNRKIVPLDKYNWSLMIRRDSGTWSTEAYFNTGFECLRSIARRLMDEELRNMHSFSISEFGKKLEEAESRIAELLSRRMKEQEAA